MGNIHKPSDNIAYKPSFILAITAAATNGTSVDTLGFETVAAIFHTKPSGTGTTSDCKLQDSADNSSFADVASYTFTQGTTVGGEQNQMLNIKTQKVRRYLRLVHTGAGGSAAGQAEGAFLLLNPRQNTLISHTTAPVTP